MEKFGQNNKSPNWLLLRGLARESRHWGQFFDQLKESYPDSKIVSLDISGNGDKWEESSSIKMSDYIPQLREKWKSIKDKTDEHWNVLGLSMGGMITLEWISKYPEDFEKAYVINSSAANLVSFYKRLSPNAIGKMLKIMLATDLKAKERGILEMTSAMPEKNKVILDQWVQIAKDSPVKHTNALKQLLASAVFRAPRKIDTPIVFLSSGQDKMVTPICSEALAKYYNSPLYTHPSAGHDITLDDSKWVLQTISQTL